MGDTETSIRLVDVSVRNLGGVTWSEQWALEKLAYFILMSDIDPPKFERSLQTEWVPFDANLYSWDKAALTRDQFLSLASQWPKNEPVAFDPSGCERVQFSYRSSEGMVGVGFNPAAQPDLYSTLLRVCGARVRFVEFDYAYGRDVFECVVNQQITSDLIRHGAARAALRNVSPQLLAALARPETRELKMRLLCRRGSFEVPFSLWFDA